MSTVRTGRPQWPIVAAVIVAAVLGALGEYQLGYHQRPSHTAIARPPPGGTTIPSGTWEPRPAPLVAPGGRPATVPAAGTGAFVVADGSGRRIGTGPALIRYQVVVELVEPLAEPPSAPVSQLTGGVSAEAFALVVEATLADPRGWTASGTWSFVRVSSDPNLVVRLTTPGTTDQRCAEYGLATAGEVSCRGGDEIMINLKRWLLAVPWYYDALADYRHMVINHEVGHFLGFDHVECRGIGELAAVMQAQTYGLGACTRNPWPFPDGRSYLG